jgi:hypothetical protein
MASDAAAPNVGNAIRFEENGCIAPGGLAAAPRYHAASAVAADRRLAS